MAPNFCQFLRAAGYMLTLPESRPPGDGPRATEEHWTPGSERPGVKPRGCGNLPWTHTLGGERVLPVFSALIPTQHLELELAGTWKISLSMSLFISLPFFIYEIVVLSTRCGAGKAGSVFQRRLITSSHPAPGGSIIVSI